MNVIRSVEPNGEGGAMKLRLILPALAALALFQLAPQAAYSWGGCNRYGYMPPWEARRIWRAEHFGYARPYGYYAPAPAPYCYNGGFLTHVGRAIL
jgi:hypothetical protein